MFIFLFVYLFYMIKIINISVTLRVTLIMVDFIFLMKITLISWNLLNWKTNQFLHLMIFYFYYKIVGVQNLNCMIFHISFLYFKVYLIALHINPFPWPSSFLVHYILSYSLNLSSSLSFINHHIKLVLAVKYIFVQPLYFYIIDIVHQ